MPKDLSALTFPVFATVGNPVKQEEFQLAEAALGTHHLSSNQAQPQTI